MTKSKKEEINLFSQKEQRLVKEIEEKKRRIAELQSLNTELLQYAREHKAKIEEYFESCYAYSVKIDTTEIRKDNLNDFKKEVKRIMTSAVEKEQEHLKELQNKLQKVSSLNLAKQVDKTEKAIQVSKKKIELLQKNYILNTLREGEYNIISLENYDEEISNEAIDKLE
jgi:exonuclease VII large subunit